MIVSSPPAPAHPMIEDPLQNPVGLVMRPAHTLQLGDSLQHAAKAFRSFPQGLLPVLEQGSNTLVGCLTESALLRAMGDGLDAETAIDGFVAEAPTIRPGETGAEALRRLECSGSPALFVVDDTRWVMGFVSVSDFYPKPPTRLTTSLVGGMATPFGVYLTDGVHHGGASELALVVSGMALGAMLSVPAVVLGVIAAHIPGDYADWVATTGPVIAFALLLRSLPMAGIHAAEHMVVHAMERGEPLTPAVVRRMPRVHPRCGTNIAVGLSVFFGISQSGLTRSQDLNVLIGFLCAFSSWRTLGAQAQYWITTRKPTERHIEMGIKAARELLDKAAISNRARPSVLGRLWHSGMPHVLLGSSIMASLVYYVASLFHLVSFV